MEPVFAYLLVADSQQKVQGHHRTADSLNLENPPHLLKPPRQAEGGTKALSH